MRARGSGFLAVLLAASLTGCDGIGVGPGDIGPVQARFFGQLVLPDDVTWRSAVALPTLEDCATGRPRPDAFEFWTVSGLLDTDAFQMFSEGRAREGPGCVYLWLQVERGGTRWGDSVLVGPLSFVRPPARDSLELQVVWDGDSARIAHSRRWP